MSEDPIWTEEDQIRARFLASQVENDAADKALDAHYRPLVLAAIAAGDIGRASEIVRRCPHSVSFCFLADTVREARLAKEGAGK